MRNTRIVEMLEVTAAAALAAGRWTGMGDKHEADVASVEGARKACGDEDIAGTIVIAEGERDEAPMLHIGEEIEIAVDPIEGTSLTAYRQSDSLAVLAFAPKGALLHTPDTNVAKALKRDVEDRVVCILTETGTSTSSVRSARPVLASGPFQTLTSSRRLPD